MLALPSRRGPTRAALIRRLAVLSAASTALFATPAQAQEGWIPGVGVFIGGAFGAKKGFNWGFETFATYRFREDMCANNPRSGIGPMAQLAMVNLDGPRVTLGLQGGGELSRAGAALSGELGATYRFGDRPGFGIHTGATAIVLFFPISYRAQWLLQDHAFNVGARYAWEGQHSPVLTYGANSICMVGRPLRTAKGVACVDTRACSVGALAASVTAVNDEAFAAGLEWQGAAQYECASIPAFLQLADELLAHDAPNALIEAALAAAEDEMVHARISADLASRYLGTRVWPTLPEVPSRAPLAGRAGLVRLATESWLDGCLAEGMAAERALSASRRAIEGGAKTAQRVIARDEARHAELGWNILRWATHVGDDDARDAVRTLRNAEIPAAVGDHAGVDRYGCLGVRQINEIADRHTAKSRRRLDAWL